MTCDLNIDDSAQPIEIENDDTLAIGPSEEVGILHVPGPVSAAEVWFDVPFDWLRGCVVRAYGIVGSVRLKLGEVDLKGLAPETVAGRGKGLCLTVQGRPASAYEVTVQRVAGSPTTAGHFFARAWMGMDQAPAVATGTSRASSGTRYGVTSTPRLVSSFDRSLAYLFQAGGRRRVEIDRIAVSYSGPATSGAWSVHGARLSAEALTPDSLTAQDIEPLDGSGITSHAYLRDGAGVDPTPVTPDVFCFVLGTGSGNFEWTAEASGGPIVLRPGRVEGFEVRAEVASALDEDASVSVAFYWREIEDPPVDLAHYGFVHEWRSDEGLDPTTGEVTSWTDRLSGAVLGATSNKPDIAADDDGPFINFTASSLERLDWASAGWAIGAGTAGAYTIVAALKTNHSRYFFDAFGSGSDRLVLSRLASTSWTQALQDASDSEQAVAADSSTEWTTVILRYDAGVMKARARGVNGTNVTPTPALLAAITLTGARLGGLHTGSSSSDYIDMRLRHLAIAKRALTDDECVAVEGLMATYWNIR